MDDGGLDRARRESLEVSDERGSGRRGGWTHRRRQQPAARSEPRARPPQWRRVGEHLRCPAVMGHAGSSWAAAAPHSRESEARSEACTPRLRGTQPGRCAPPTGGRGRQAESAAAAARRSERRPPRRCPQEHVRDAQHLLVIHRRVRLSRGWRHRAEAIREHSTSELRKRQVRSRLTEQREASKGHPLIDPQAGALPQLRGRWQRRWRPRCSRAP